MAKLRLFCTDSIGRVLLGSAFSVLLLVTPNNSHAVVVSKRFERLTGTYFQCSATLQMFLVSPNLLNCALACLRLEDCTSFTTTTTITTVAAAGKLDSCAYCPDQSIAGLMFDPFESHTETWIYRVAHYTDPPFRTVLSTPGAGTIGRLVTVKGTVSVPMPEKFVLDFLKKAGREVILRFTRYAETTNYIRVNAKTDGEWSQENIRDAAPALFPFTEGEDYEIDVLTTRRGFMIYINSIYVMTYNVTISNAELIDAMHYRFAEEVSAIIF
ncbi:hypothetical protein RRG08_043694 [Elysia crispata]|uniref:Galectin n=1 Tax=Elysia crispata TaxID=231223 RepID=A0AAE0ZN35_9GAST|nr:hypothetical protein RRG08_043694 [Elysia crispata]